jgi:hypothetical protein
MNYMRGYWPNWYRQVAQWRETCLNAECMGPAGIVKSTASGSILGWSSQLQTPKWGRQ